MLVEAQISGRTLLFRDDRVKAFVEIVKSLPKDFSDWQGESLGIDGGAVLGLNTLVNHIPLKFPVIEILIFLQKVPGEPLIPLKTVEAALIELGRRFPGITGSGEDYDEQDFGFYN